MHHRVGDSKGRARWMRRAPHRDAIGLTRDEIRLSPARRTLLSWAVAKDPSAARLSIPGELLWLAVDDSAVAEVCTRGCPAWPRNGCLGLELLDRRPGNASGRWHSEPLQRLPDLNLRLAEARRAAHARSASGAGARLGHARPRRHGVGAHESRRSPGAPRRRAGVEPGARSRTVSRLLTAMAPSCRGCRSRAMRAWVTTCTAVAALS